VAPKPKMANKGAHLTRYWILIQWSMKWWLLTIHIWKLSTS